MVFFLWVVLFLGCAQHTVANDLIVTPGQKGYVVVDQVVRLIQQECIFADDRLFLRRLAYVESRDGALSDTYAAGYHGGIWKVDEDMFKTTQSDAALEYLENEIAAMNASAVLGYIDWTSVRWGDLRKPLYSGLGARLFLQFVSTGTNIPTRIKDQAIYWEVFYRQGGDIEDYMSAAGSLRMGCTGKEVDIVFVLDSSTSIWPKNFVKIKDFVVGIVSEFDVAPNTTQIGVLKFNNDVHEEFKLNSYKTRAEVIDAVKNINQGFGDTNTSEALRFLREVALSPESGATRRVPRVGVVLTDGESTDPYETLRQAALCKAANLSMLAIGVGSELDKKELEAIASRPLCQYLFELEEFDDFAGLADSIHKRSCEAPIELKPGEGDRDASLSPGGNQNCRVTIPEEGATIKITVHNGSVRYYVAESTYPSEAYYDDKLEVGTGETSALNLTRPASGESLFCNIKGDNFEGSDIEIELHAGARTWDCSEFCQNGGTCVKTKQDYECRCVKGYEGPTCEIAMTGCQSQPCHNGATCHDDISRDEGYRCECSAGWIGKDCDCVIDHCGSSPCKNGVCESEVDGYKCVCNAGWTGSNCDQLVDNCHSSPCKNGDCENEIGGYKCICVSGWEGSTCENLVDNCDPNPCKHGICENDIGEYQCMCNVGWTGLKCETVIDYCDSNPCETGVCNNEIGGFKCDCDVGWTGLACEHLIDSCESNPCKHGTCENVAGGFKCICDLGWTGLSCEHTINHCESNPCKNGICENELGGFRCICNEGWTSAACENLIDNCEPNPCKHGICRNAIGEFECVCDEGWIGLTCENSIGVCKSDPCQNGGKCHHDNTKDGGYWCECSQGWTGHNCDCGEWFTCSCNNPCTPDNIKAGKFFHPHKEPTRFIECDQQGECHERECSEGLEWDQATLACKTCSENILNPPEIQ